MTTLVRLAYIHAPGDDVARMLRVMSGERDIQIVLHTTVDGADRAMRDLAADALALRVTGAVPERSLVETIMSRAPIPIILLADSLPDPQAMQLMQVGALDAVPLPAVGDAVAEAALRRTIRMLAGVRVVAHRSPRARRAGTSRTPVVGIGASTGGPEALSILLRDLAGINAPILLVQHIPPAFLQGFVDWLQTVTRLRVVIAIEGDVAEPGTVYVAPNHVHLGLGQGDRIALFAAETRTLHIPSATALLANLAEHDPTRVVGVVLTGMGDDGAVGLKALAERGGYTIVQDEASSTVFGMGRAALKLMRANEVLPLDRIAPAVLAATHRIAP